MFSYRNTYSVSVDLHRHLEPSLAAKYVGCVYLTPIPPVLVPGPRAGPEGSSSLSVGVGEQVAKDTCQRGEEMARASTVHTSLSHQTSLVKILLRFKK